MKHLSKKSKDRLKESTAKKTLEDINYNFGRSTSEIYKINFLRGIFFGLGSALGGTLVVAIIVWIMSAVGGLIPFLGQFINDVIDAMG